MRNGRMGGQHGKGRLLPIAVCDLLKHAARIGIALTVVTAGSGLRAEVVVEAREPTPDEIAAAAAAPVAPPESRLTITANVPFEKAAAVANRYQLATHAKGTVMGFLSYDGVLSLGKVKLVVSEEAQYPMRIVAPFSLTGTLGGGALNEAGEATINMAIRVQQDWCPVVEFGNVEVTLNDASRGNAAIAPAGPMFSEFVATQFLSGQLKSWATCDKIKEAVNKFWRPVVFAIDANSRNFLNVDPRSIALSQIAVSGNNLKFVAAIGTVAALGSKAINTAVKPLPRVAPSLGAEPSADIGVSVTLNLVTP